MKTREMAVLITGMALAYGTIFAQVAGPQGQGPRGGGAGFFPPGEGRSQREQQGPRGGGTCPAMRQGQGPQAQGGGPSRMKRGGFGFEGGPREFPDPKRLKEAGATDQQLEALKTFAGEQQFKRIDLKATVEKAELAFEQLMGSETVDEPAALKAADAVGQARIDLFKLEIRAKLKAREILGTEVLKKLREMGPPEGAERQRRGQRTEGQPCQSEKPGSDSPQNP